MVTMLDVAKKAGVSKATVSRVLNDKNIVSDAIKKKVFKAIQETGYRPNLLARQMAMQKTNLIGLVMTNGLYNGPYFSSLVYAAASVSEKYQHQLMLADGKHCAGDERQAINYLLDMRCAGILIYPEYLNVKELSNIIATSNTPIIVINRELAGCKQNCVFMDHYHSMELMMDYVIAQGHRQIAFIKGREHSSSGQLRYQAYCDKLTANHIELDLKRVVSGSWSLQSGYHAVQELLARNVAFSMIVASNDDMASGAMKALREVGLRVPEDVSISGVDNSPFSQYIYPALTTVNVPIQQMVEQGILQLIDSEDIKTSQPIEGKLIIRDSVLLHSKSC